MATIAANMPNPTRNIKTGYIFMAAAALLALITGIIFVNIIMGIVNRPAPKMAALPIVVASHNVLPGQVLALADLKVVDWPKEYIPEGEVFSAPADLVGRVAKSEVQPGEPIYRAKLAGELSTGGLKVIIPKGLRAITVSVSEVSGVAGFVKPGDRVDVIATFKNLGKGDQRFEKTTTVLQDVMVLAAAQKMTNKDLMKKAPEATPEAGDTGTQTGAMKDPKAAQAVAHENTKDTPAQLVSSVTLALSPSQIEKIALADETAKIRLVLRSEEDHTYADVSGITKEQLAQGAVRPTAPAPRVRRSYVAPPKYFEPPKMTVSGTIIELIDGDAKSSVEFY